MDSPIFSPEIGSAESGSTDVSEENNMLTPVAKSAEATGYTPRGNAVKKPVPLSGTYPGDENIYFYMRDRCHEHIDTLVAYLRVLEFIRYGDENHVIEEPLRDLLWDSNSDEDVVVERLARVGERVLTLENYYRVGRRLDEYEKAIAAPRIPFILYALNICRALEARLLWVFHELVPDSTCSLIPDASLIPHGYPHIPGPLAKPRKGGREFQ